MDHAKRTMSGSKGEIWLDGEQMGECYGFQAKVTLNKTEIHRCGAAWTEQKVMSKSGRGSVRMHKVNSRMARLIGDAVRQGRDPLFVIISKLDDPDAYGAERVAVKNVSFDDLTLADWEANNPGRVEAPFTFSDYEYLDLAEENA